MFFWYQISRKALNSGVSTDSWLQVGWPHPESIATETLEEKGKKGAKKEEGIRESAKQVFRMGG